MRFKWFKDHVTSGVGGGWSHSEGLGVAQICNILQAGLREGEGGIQHPGVSNFIFTLFSQIFTNSTKGG